MAQDTKKRVSGDFFITHRRRVFLMVDLSAACIGEVSSSPKGAMC